MDRGIMRGLTGLLCAAALLGPARAEEIRPLADLNHFYVVLDEPTARAIEASEYLRRFANVAVKAVSSSEGRYRGLYLLGRETYVELFSPAGYDLDAPPAAVGKLGLALGTDKIGGLSRIQAEMANAGARAELTTTKATVDGRTIDWFRSLAPTAPTPPAPARGPAVEIWAMEYLPAYFEARTDNKEPPEGEDDLISRERYQSDGYQRHMMRDVTGLTLAVTREDWTGLRPLLAAAGVPIVEDSAGAQASGKVRLRFEFVPRALVGLRQVEFALNAAPSERRVEHLGHSSLAVGPNGGAIWSFDPPDAR